MNHNNWKRLGHLNVLRINNAQMAALNHPAFIQDNMKTETGKGRSVKDPRFLAWYIN